MIAKTWKKIGVIILIIVCLYNVMSKIVKKVSFDAEMESTAVYYNNVKKTEIKEEKKANENNDNFNIFTDYNTLFNN